MLTGAPTPARSLPLSPVLALTALAFADPVEFPAGPSGAPGGGAFALDRTEVSVQDFERFVAEGWSTDAHWSAGGRAWRQAHPEGAGPDTRRAGRDPTHPVVAVTFWEAEAFCAWRGGRLPTEWEWERAASGDRGSRYPWGDAQDAPAQWYAGSKYGQIHSVNTRPVDNSDPATDSPQGVRHLAGNVWEWTASVYSPKVDTWRTLRGGSFLNLPSYATATHREPARPERVAFTTGFRCAYDR